MKSRKEKGCWRKIFYMLIILTFCFQLTGCAIIQLPFKVIQATFDIIKKLPTPPPGVF